jgi:hypothetical protein
MQTHRLLLSGLLILSFCCVPETAYAKKRRRAYRRPVTHPVVLWSRTLSESTDKEERKVAAFKLSQYTQQIYQEEVVSTLGRCLKDGDVQIKVLCAKAMGRAGMQSRNESIRKLLIETYKEDPSLRSTLVRTFMVRKDNSPAVRDAFLENLKKSTDTDELIAHLGYFESYATSAEVDTIVDVYNKSEDNKIKRAAVKVLSERGQAQSAVVSLLSSCAEGKDTPLALICLSGLQHQAKKDSKVWAVLEKTIKSGDPDVVLATLDVIHALPEQVNSLISTRLVEITNNADDNELLEKAILALGVCGDRSEEVVAALQRHMERKETEEGIRITTALVIGRQGAGYPEGPKAALSKCLKESKTQSLRTACQLGLQELDARKALAQPVPEQKDRKPTASTEESDDDSESEN